MGVTDPPIVSHPCAILARCPWMRHFTSMSTLAEIEAAVPRLSVEELAQLERFIRQARQEKQRSKPHSVLDLKPVHLGEMLRPLGDREEWYDEMREDRV